MLKYSSLIVYPNLILELDTVLLGSYRTDTLKENGKKKVYIIYREAINCKIVKTSI